MRKFCPKTRKTRKNAFYGGHTLRAQNCRSYIYYRGGTPPPPLSRGKRGGIPPKTPKTGVLGGGPNRFFGVPEKTRTALELSVLEGSGPPHPPQDSGMGGVRGVKPPFWGFWGFWGGTPPWTPILGAREYASSRKTGHFCPVFEKYFS